MLYICIIYTLFVLVTSSELNFLLLSGVFFQQYGIRDNKKRTLTVSLEGVFLQVCCSYLRFIMTAAMMHQMISMTILMSRTGIKPIVKTRVNARAVQSPPPMKGSWISCL